MKAKAWHSPGLINNPVKSEIYRDYGIQCWRQLFDGDLCLTECLTIMWMPETGRCLTKPAFTQLVYAVTRNIRGHIQKNGLGFLARKLLVQNIAR